MSQVAVVAKITVQEGKRAEAITGFGPLMDHVETEPGTLSYILHEDSADENVLWMYELYRDQAAFDAHRTSDAMKTLGAPLGAVFARRPELSVTTPIRGKGL